LKSLRDDLVVYIWGVKFDKKDDGWFKNFWDKFIDTQIYASGFPMIQLSERAIEFLQNNDQKRLTEFYKLMHKVEFHENFDDWSLVSKMLNVKLISTSIVLTEKNFKNLLTLLPNIEEIQLFSTDDTNQYKNNVLDYLPKFCNLQSLVLVSEAPLNYDFLFKIKYLKNLALMVKYPLTDQQFVQLIKEKFKFLRKVDMSYPKPTSTSKDQLKSFKDSVLKCFNGELNESPWVKEFKIFQIHSIQNRSFLRYLYYRKISADHGELDHLYENLPEDDEIIKTMTSMIGQF